MEEANRRSSIRKPRSTNENADNSENPDATLVKARRVSFASSHAVKRFLNDPENNTIWDNTYEEEVNHDDSVTPKIIASSEIVVTYEMMQSENKTIEYTNIKENVKTKSHQLIETIYDKENIIPQIENNMVLQAPKTISSVRNDAEGKLTCQHSKVINAPNRSTMNSSIKTNLDDCDMEFTSVISTGFGNPHVNVSNMELTCCERTLHLGSTKNNIYLNESMVSNINTSRVDNVDMELTGVIQDIKSNKDMLSTSFHQEDESKNKVNQIDPMIDMTNVMDDMEFSDIIQVRISETPLEKNDAKNITNIDVAQLEDNTNVQYLNTDMDISETSFNIKKECEKNSRINHKLSNVTGSDSKDCPIMSTLQDSKDINDFIIPNKAVTEQPNNSSLQLNKVIYSEPLIIKQNDDLRITDEIKNFNCSIQKPTGELKTPQISFRLNYSNMSPCIDNTQQLINAMVPKASSFSFSTDVKQDFTVPSNPIESKSFLKSPDKGTAGVTFTVESKHLQEEIENELEEPHTRDKIAITFVKDSKECDILKEHCSVSTTSDLTQHNINKHPPSDEHSLFNINDKTKQIIANQPMNELNYTVREKQIFLDPFEDSPENMVNLKVSCFLEDETAEIVNSSNEDVATNTKISRNKYCTTGNTLSNKSVVEGCVNQNRSMEDMDIESTDYFKNYTQRVEKKLSDISRLQLVKWKPSIKSNAELENLLEKLDKLDGQLKESVKELKNKIDNLEEKIFDNESKDTFSISSNSNNSNSKSEEMENDKLSSGNKQNMSWYQRILEAPLKSGWKLHTHKNDKYFFSTLYETIVFIVTLEPDSGKVCNVNVQSTLSDDSSAFGKFMHRQHLYYLREDWLNTIIDQELDIICFLNNCICATYHSMTKFTDKFEVIEKNFGRKKYIYNFGITSNFSICFHVVNINEMTYWEVLIKVNDVQQMDPKDVTLSTVYGKNFIKEQKLQEYVSNRFPNHCSLRKLLNALYEYIYRKTKRKWKK